MSIAPRVERAMGATLECNVIWAIAHQSRKPKTMREAAKSVRDVHRSLGWSRLHVRANALPMIPSAIPSAMRLVLNSVGDNKRLQNGPAARKAFSQSNKTAITNGAAVITAINRTTSFHVLPVRIFRLYNGLHAQQLIPTLYIFSE
jgi:hypothetical protein